MPVGATTLRYAFRRLDSDSMPADGDMPGRLPAPRGAASGYVIGHLRRPIHTLGALPPPSDGPLDGDDFHLALYVCYELHYRGFVDVEEEWEWEPSLLALRSQLESRFERAVVSGIGIAPSGPAAPDEVTAAVRQAIEDSDGPSLSEFVAKHGSISHLRELAVHRSAYQLKEADPHTWAIPRLAGRPKAAMVEIQSDEYGRGVEREMHASLFADTMAALGLDSSYGAYVDRLPGSTLATVNLVSMFGLHRRLRGALVGHLAAFEMTSCEPMGRYASAIDRLGLGPEARRFYDVHVEADVHHAEVAATQMAAGLAVMEPELAGDIVLGAKALLAVEARFASHILDTWSKGRSSLLACAKHGLSR